MKPQNERRPLNYIAPNSISRVEISHRVVYFHTSLAYWPRYTASIATITMSPPTPAMIRTLFDNCRQSDTIDPYRCTQSSLNDLVSSRSLREVLLRSLAIHVIAISSYGHLLSLQGFTHRRSPSWALLLLLGFIIFPELPAVQLLIRLVKVSYHAATMRHPKSSRYWIASCLGSYILVNGKVHWLDDIEFREIRAGSSRRNVTWIGRLLVMLLLACQYVSSIAVLFRGLLIFYDKPNLYFFQDVRNFEVLLGGAVATCNSLCLHALNYEWTHSPPNTDPDAIQQMEVQEQIRTGNRESIKDLGTILQWANDLNTRLAKWLAETIPQEVQFALEHGLVTQRAYDLLICYHSGLLQNEPAARFVRFDCDVHVGSVEPDPTCNVLHPSLHGRLRYLPLFNIATGWRNYGALPVIHIMICTNIGRILLGDLVQLYIWSSPESSRYAKQCQTWVLGGRSIPSFALALVGLVLNIVLRTMNYSAALVGNTNSDPGLLGAVVRYKDPWYDSMYVL